MRLFLVSTTLTLLVLMCASAAASQTARLWTVPKAGVWSVSGKDRENTHWSARMHLAVTGNRGLTALYRGYFYWWSPDSDSKGYEYFTGRFDRRTGVLKLHGSHVKSLRGELGTGDYRAHLQKGSRVYSGIWAGENAIPGTWSGRWSRNH